MGRRAHQKTEQNARTAQSMAQYGVPQKDIAAVLGISIDILRRYYLEEMDKGAALANAKVAETLFRKATEGGGDVSALIFWAKTRMRWRTVDNPEKDAAEKPLPLYEGKR